MTQMSNGAKMVPISKYSILLFSDPKVVTYSIAAKLPKKDVTWMHKSYFSKRAEKKTALLFFLKYFFFQFAVMGYYVRIKETNKVPEQFAHKYDYEVNEAFAKM